MKNNSLLDTLAKINSNDFVIFVSVLGYVGIPLSLRLAIHGFKVFGRLIAVTHF